jgi:hypothetical protein
MHYLPGMKKEKETFCASELGLKISAAIVVLAKLFSIRVLIENFFTNLGTEILHS